MREWLAGAASADITPRQTGYWLGGYLPRRRAAQIHRPLFARVVWLEAQGRTLVWVALDLLTFKNRTTRAVRQAVSTATGVSPGDVWVMATHTHSAPDLVGLFGGPPPGYEALLAARVAEAAHAAQGARRPAVLSLAKGKLKDVAYNRREDGQPRRDDDLVVLTAATPAGKTIFTLVNTSCHPVVMGRESQWVSPDFIGGLCEGIEAKRGGLGVFVNRAHGDVNPDLSPWGMEEANKNLDPAVADAFGLAMAHQVTRMKPGRRLAPSLSSKVWDVNIPVSEIGMTVLGIAGFGELTARRRLRGETARAVLGDAEVMTLPGEVTGRFSRMVQQSNPRLDLVFGLQGGYAGYLLTEDEVNPDAYEEKLFVGNAMPRMARQWARLPVP